MLVFISQFLSFAAGGMAQRTHGVFLSSSFYLFKSIRFLLSLALLIPHSLTDCKRLTVSDIRNAIKTHVHKTFRKFKTPPTLVCSRISALNMQEKFLLFIGTLLNLSLVLALCSHQTFYHLSLELTATEVTMSLQA